MERVLLTPHLPEDVVGDMRSVADIIMPSQSGSLMSRDEVLDLAADVVGIINQTELRIDKELLDRAPKLRIVANVATGTDNMDLPLMAERGVWASNTPDSFRDPTADLTMGLLLCLARRIPEANDFVKSGRWTKIQYGIWDGDLLEGRTLGLFGFGRIGQAVAKRATSFGMNIIHCHAGPCNKPGHQTPDQVLALSDYVSMHVPLKPETRNFMNLSRFRQMKRGSYFLNLSRGATVVESDLVQALSEGHLGGAALDVFEKEPGVHPGLLKLPNVILTPHIGGSARQSRFNARRLALENVMAVLRGRRPITPVGRPVA